MLSQRGTAQGKQKDASTFHAADNGSARGQAQPQSGAQKKVAQARNLQESNLEGENPGQGINAPSFLCAVSFMKMILLLV